MFRRKDNFAFGVRLFSFEDTLGGISYRGLRKSEKDGVDGGEDPPVPIPNTEVKLT